MTQPEIDGVGLGKPVMPFGSDGAKWIAFLIDALGHLQVDVVSAALGSGGATETTLLLIKGYVDALETLLAGGLPAALDSGALKVKEQSPLTGFATSANQATMITALQLIDDLRAALGSVNTDDLQVDVKTSALPTDAATQTTLALVKTAVEKIDDLQGALGSVATDILRVASEGGDKIFGYKDQYAESGSDLSALAGTNDKDLSAVPAGEAWVITCIYGINTTTAVIVRHRAVIGAAGFIVNQKTQANITEAIVYNGTLILKEGNYICVRFSGCILGDDLFWGALGYKMSL